MGKPAVSLRNKLIAFCAAGLLACGLLPMLALADNSQDESVAGPLAGPGYEGDAQSASPNPALSSGAEGVTLASTLAGSAASIVSADVALDAADPIVGSFTLDGLTYAVGPDGLALVAVGASAVSDGTIAIPATVAYDGVAYDVTSVGPYAFYLSGAIDVALPASVASVDDRAFRSSDVERVKVDPANPNLTSFDSALYSADKSRLLLIPEGRAGAVLLPCEAEVVEASKFSHCSLVDAIDAEEGGAAFASWDGLLYNTDGTTLLRVPAGATEVAIRDSCTAIAAGAMEGCAKLERINAPASVTSISPDLFQSVPTVSLPAQSALQDGSQVDFVAGPLAGPGYEGDAQSASADSPAEGEAAAQLSSQDETTSGVASSLLDQAKKPADSAPQLTAMVALSSIDDDLPEVDPASITMRLPEGGDQEVWRFTGFAVVNDGIAGGVEPVVDALSQAESKAATYYTVTVHPNGHTLNYAYYGWQATTDNRSPIRSGTLSGSSTIYDQWVTNIDVWPNALALGFNDRNTLGIAGYYDIYSFSNGTPGWSINGFSYSAGGAPITDRHPNRSGTMYALWRAHTYTISLDAQGGTVSSTAIPATYDQDAMLPEPIRTGYRFLGWNTIANGTGTMYQADTVRNLTTDDGASVILYAQWERVDFDIGFDVDSEPDDVEYPGDAKDDQKVNLDDGHVPIEDPKRPGYVFEGWVIPTKDGTEAVDQELVYQGDDGKWYVDASKMPDYAGDDGRVELTARWTSVISVDVPSSVTFYADLVTGQQDPQGEKAQASREGAASGAFGQSKVENQSQVDLRVVGLESSAVKTTDTTLGADSILKKADAAPPSTSTQKLLSLYPSTKQWKPEELQKPDAVGGAKAATAVDFDLNDILLEKSFAADDFTIAAGDTLNMGYRLNLSETGQQLDYDALSTLSEGQSAAIANVSYCFAADALPSDWDEPLWIENPDRTSNPAKYLLLKDIKATADDLSANGTSSEYYSLYKDLLDKQMMQTTETEATSGTVTYGPGPYFQLQVDGVYLPLQLIGICQDTRSDGTGKAGLTFQMRDIYACGTKGSNGAFDCRMNTSDTNSGGWGSSGMKETLASTFRGCLPAEVRSAIAPVDKFQQLPGGTTAAYLQKTTGETVWLPSMYEVFGVSFASCNESEALTNVTGYVPFQYIAYQGNTGSPTNAKAAKTYNGSANNWWLRTGRQGNTTGFCLVHLSGSRSGNSASNPFGAAPCFCL